MRPYPCGIAIYQLSNLRMLEFYYNFLDKYLDQSDFELIQMDADSMYMAISGTFNKIVRWELRSQHEVRAADNGGKAEFLSTSKYHDRTLGLFKAEFQSTRMIALTSKCYYAEDNKSRSFAKPKISCKGVMKKQNSMSWPR